jgi:hypothetical protein
LRDLNLKGLQARWRGLFRKAAPPHLPRHLLIGMIAYRLQADEFGDLDSATRRALEQSTGVQSRKKVADQLQILDRQQSSSARGTVLMREWKGRKHRVMVMADGFAWKGKTFKSLSAVASSMTGTKWNGPRFFGLRSAEPGKRSKQEQ